MATQAAPKQGKVTKLTLKRVNELGNQPPTIDVASGKTEWVLGRDDPKTKPDIDLGKDSACSRRQGTIVYKSDIFTFNQEQSTAVAGYVMKLGQKFQILEEFVLDFGGKQKTLATFTNVLPTKQMRDMPKTVLSPQFIQEGKTDPLIKDKDVKMSISVQRITKQGEQQVDIRGQKSLTVDDSNSPQEWDLESSEIQPLFTTEFKGKLRIAYQPLQSAEDATWKGFWYAEVLEEDPNCPIVLYFLKKDQLKANKKSEDFILYNGLRVFFGLAQYEIQVE